MKILYIGPYRDGTGWAEAAIRIILSLDKAGGDIVIRPIRYNKNNNKISDKILSLEQKNTQNVDIVIQNVLPHHMEYSAGFCNIGYWVTETDTYKTTQWSHHINMMDGGIVQDISVKTAAEKMGINIPIEEFNIAAYDDVYDIKYPIPTIPNLEQRYQFYYIGEFTKRKNLFATLCAFHTEFDPHENVQLVLKVSIPGLNTIQTKQAIEGYCDNVKKELRLYKDKSYYSQEIIVTDRLSDEEIYGLHQHLDCFVVTSHGEGLCIPAMDAALSGNDVIASDVGGLTKAMSFTQHKYPITGEMYPCFGANDTLSDLYTGHDNWFYPNINELKKAMRDSFNKGKRKKIPFTPKEATMSFCGQQLIHSLERLYHV